MAKKSYKDVQRVIETDDEGKKLVETLCSEMGIYVYKFRLKVDSELYILTFKCDVMEYDFIRRRLAEEVKYTIHAERCQ